MGEPATSLDLAEPADGPEHLDRLLRLLATMRLSDADRAAVLRKALEQVDPTVRYRAEIDDLPDRYGSEGALSIAERQRRKRLREDLRLVGVAPLFVAEETVSRLVTGGIFRATSTSPRERAEDAEFALALLADSLP